MEQNLLNQVLKDGFVKKYQVRLRDSNVDGGSYTEFIKFCDTLEDAKKEVQKRNVMGSGDDSISYFIVESYVKKLF